MCIKPEGRNQRIKKNMTGKQFVFLSEVVIKMKLLVKFLESHKFNIFIPSIISIFGI